jgi:hypothetical protein
MNTKKLVIFGSSAVVLAGVLVYALGIYPPASGRDGRGAIGQRNVYRADQPADASVNPNDAPVATADELKSGQVVSLQDGMIYRMSDGQMFQLQNGQMMRLQDGMVYHLNSGEMIKLNGGMVERMTNGQFVRQMNNNQFVHQLNSGQMVALNGFIFKMMNNGQFVRQMSVNQMQQNQLRDQMHDQMQTK